MPSYNKVREGGKVGPTLQGVSRHLERRVWRVRRDVLVRRISSTVINCQATTALVRKTYLSVGMYCMYVCTYLPTCMYVGFEISLGSGWAVRAIVARGMKEARDRSWLRHLPVIVGRFVASLAGGGAERGAEAGKRIGATG
jgi:hypothetical protein